MERLTIIEMRLGELERKYNSLQRIVQPIATASTEHRDWIAGLKDELSRINSELNDIHYAPPNFGGKYYKIAEKEFNDMAEKLGGF